MRLVHIEVAVTEATRPAVFRLAEAVPVELLEAAAIVVVQLVLEALATAQALVAALLVVIEAVVGVVAVHLVNLSTRENL